LTAAKVSYLDFMVISEWFQFDEIFFTKALCFETFAFSRKSQLLAIDSRSPGLYLCPRKISL